jgi:cobalt-zinc-cadmium efflux system membrane fusion protein
MAARFRALLAQAAPYVSTPVVLALLGGLGYLGYRNDWKVPKFAELFGQTTANKPKGEKEEDEGDGDPSDPYPFVLFPEPRVRLASKEAVRQAGIQLGRVEVQDLEQIATAPGSIEFAPTRYAQVSTRAPGVVWKVYKQVGDRVARGEVLALVDAAEVGRAKTDFLQALVQFDARSKTLQRLQAASNLPESQRQEAEAAKREAHVRLLTQQQALVNLGLPFKVEDVTALDDKSALRYLRTLGLPADLAGRADADSLSANLLPLTAPFDGVVLRHNAAVGEVVGSTTLTGTAQPQFVVADPTQVWVLLDLRIEDLRGLDRRGGQRVTFQPDGHGDKADADPGPSGVIDWVSPEVDDKTHAVHVRVPIKNPEGRLRPGTHGLGRIVVREQPQALTVPSEAVQRDGDVFLVFVKVNDKTFEARQVFPGIRDGKRTQVVPAAPFIASATAGLVAAPVLGPSDEVAAAGSHVLKSELFKDRISGDE